MLTRLLLGLALSAAIAAFALVRRSLTRNGALAACAVGTGMYAGLGAAGFSALCAFFFTSTLLGKFGKAQKAPLARDYEKSDTRDAWQVLANGGVALASALIALHDARFAGAFLGALGTAAGDTWATEIGVLSRAEPISLASLRRVPRGTSGAVSSLGLLATFAGGACVGLVYAAWSADLTMLLRYALWTGVAGLLGALADSAVGAFIQARHYCDTCGRPCEGALHGCGARTRKIAGIAQVNNDVVNLVATAVGAVLGYLFITD